MNDPKPLTGVNKPMSMTSLYLDPISIEPNVGMNEDCSATRNVMENVEASRTNNKPRSVTTLSKSSVIFGDRDDVDKNIHVLISQVLGIVPKKNVVSNVSTSLAQQDNNTENPKNNLDVNAPTFSLEKSQDKERYEDITNRLDKNHVDQPTNIVNIEDLDSDDVPIGKRLAPSIAKRFKNRKGQAVGFSNTPSKSVKKKTSVHPTKRWSKLALSEEEGGVKDDGTNGEKANEYITDASDEEETSSD
ncbi:hypothetical protein KIW84_024266 [Lathyrus oleraceus]|uniref:Uncharacterized protein n=1 Tax=Pisum sativum TaxID=3888 RepID=A0A9D4YF62_PEA|nr:hypothetical protein KIW84_024266 [Pisum sativum]